MDAAAFAEEMSFVIRATRLHVLSTRWQEAAALLFGAVLLPTLFSFGLTPRPSLRLLLWSLFVAAVVVLTLAFIEVDVNLSRSVLESQRARRCRWALLRLTVWTSVANLLPLVLLIAVALICGISLRIHRNSPGVVKLMGVLLFCSLFVWTGRAVWGRIYRAARDYRSLAQVPAQTQVSPAETMP
ncbi:MAG: hypothetical protein WAM39_10510 [Bryobacteraceae bacterium]